MEIKCFKLSKGKMINQCYLVYQDRCGILIDPAWDYQTIHSFIVTNQIQLEGVVLTHHHQDHVDLADEFAERYQVPVYLSEEEIIDSGFACKNLQKANHLEVIPFSTLSVIPLLTPGHTLGSTCFLIDGHLFTGDTLFIEGVGICEKETVDLLYKSIQFLKIYLPLETCIWPGHCFGEPPGRTWEYLFDYNIYLQFNEREFIHFRLRKNRPDSYLFR